MSETEYQRAWRERGEVERALRQWNCNQSSPVFTKGAAIVGGIIGGPMVAYAPEAGWTGIPVALLGLLFMSMLFIAPSMLRDEAKTREEALETLQRLAPHLLATRGEPRRVK